MTIETTSMPSRRALLAGTLGGAVALVAGALGRPLSGLAANGDVIHVGDAVSGDRETTFTNTDGTALKGVSSDTSGSGNAIGVFGEATATSGDTTGVAGRTWSPDGIGVLGTADNPPEGGQSGRGGWFSGGTAQIRLEPAGTAHPVSGLLGDLFLDHDGALWFCKGDTDWKQIA